MKFYICRLCLKHQEFLIYIFRDREPERLIRKMIANTLQLRVSKDDCLPPTVCKRCVQKLKDFFLFKKDCVRAKSIFLEFSTSFKGEDDISMGNKESDDVSTEKFSSDWNDTADCEVVAHVINSKKNKYSGAKIRGKEKRQKNGVVRNVMTSLPLPSCSTAVSPKEVRRVCSEPYFDDNDCMPSSSTDDFNVSSNNNENQNCEEINIEDPQPSNEPPEEVNDNDHEVMTDLASIKMEEIDLVDDEPTMELVGERYIDYSILPVKREAVNPPSVEVESQVSPVLVEVESGKDFASMCYICDRLFSTKKGASIHMKRMHLISMASKKQTVKKRRRKTKSRSKLFRVRKVKKYVIPKSVPSTAIPQGTDLNSIPEKL